jgi:hypothetical protein
VFGKLTTALVALVSLTTMLPAAAHAQETYPPDGPVGMVLDPATCTVTTLTGYVHGAVPGSTVHFAIKYPAFSTSVDSVADAQGRAPLATPIPVPRPTGVVVTSSGTSPTGQFTVDGFALTSVVSFAGCPIGETLGDTGANVMPWVRAGVGSLAAGGLFLVAARRRRTVRRATAG